MRRHQAAIVTGVSTVVLGAGWAAGLVTAANTAPSTLADSSTEVSTSVVTVTETQTANASETASDTATSTTTAAASETTAAATDGTYTGAAVTTRYGDFQAQITVQDGTITAVTVVQSGDSDHESTRINDRALPTLVERVLEAQTWDVDGVSGASYTSPAFLSSVQDALEQAGLA